MEVNKQKVLRASQTIKAFMLDAEHFDNIAKQSKENSEKDRLAIKKDMIENGVDVYIVDEGDDKQFLKATLYKMSKVIYDVEAIKEKLTKKQKSLVTNSLMIVEQEGLKEFIKSNPGLRQELKKFISKIDVVDEHKLSIAIEHGHISLDDIKDCYSVSDKDILKIQRVKKFDLLD